MNYRNTILISLAFVLVVSTNGSFAEARDLVDAAQTAQSLLNKIGIAAISIGLTAGGIAYAAGAAMVGRMVITSGAIGAAVILGAPALIGFAGRVFGASI